MKYFATLRVLMLFFVFQLACTAQTQAAQPNLLFSDITSGPRTGLTDNVVSNQGAIVTIWGANLGSAQGASNVYIGSGSAWSPAAHIYFWGDADGQSGGGPANLSTYHQMQEISFAIPSASAIGLTEIKVTVNGVDSNSLSFTIRSEGNIYFTSAAGSDSTGNGSWSSPWATISNLTSGASDKMNPGDIVYGLGQIEGDIVFRNKIGTEALPFAVISYPGYVIQSNGGISKYMGTAQYWHISKVRVVSNGTGISTIKGGRIVGNEITDNTCADGQSGAISGSNFNYPDSMVGNRVFGNYIHDWGGTCTTSLHHVFYLSNRGGTAVEAFELGWNYLTDNEANGALHVYDEGICGDYTGTIKIHDNVVVNQAGPGAGVSAGLGGTDCISAPIEFINNVLINTGLPPFNNRAITLNKSGLSSHVKFYNNTIYGYATSGEGEALWIQGSGSASWVFGGTFEWVNNIVVDTNDRPFENPTYSAMPTVKGNNLWYDGGNGTPSPPPWDNSPILTDPLLGSFKQLLENSPAISAGATISIVPTDIQGNKRQSGSYDIGAFNFSSMEETPTILNIKIQ